MKVIQKKLIFCKTQAAFFFEKTPVEGIQQLNLQQFLSRKLNL